MTDDELRAVIVERLGRWTQRLAELHATPIALIGVGQDDQRGQVQVITLDAPELSTEVLTAFLLHAVDLLRHVTPAARPDPQWTRSPLEHVLAHLRAAHVQANVAAGLGNICKTCEQFVRGLGGS